MSCYCHTCKRDFHWLGITRHRKMHLERGEAVTITYTHGDTWTHRPQPRKEISNPEQRGKHYDGTV